MICVGLGVGGGVDNRQHSTAYTLLSSSALYVIRSTPYTLHVGPYSAFYSYTLYASYTLRYTSHCAFYILQSIPEIQCVCSVSPFYTCHCALGTIYTLHPTLYTLHEV